MSSHSLIPFFSFSFFHSFSSYLSPGYSPLSFIALVFTLNPHTLLLLFSSSMSTVAYSAVPSEENDHVTRPAKPHYPHQDLPQFTVRKNGRAPIVCGVLCPHCYNTYTAIVVSIFLFFAPRLLKVACRVGWHRYWSSVVLHQHVFRTSDWLDQHDVSAIIASRIRDLQVLQVLSQGAIWSCREHCLAIHCRGHRNHALGRWVCRHHSCIADDDP